MAEFSLKLLSQLAVGFTAVKWVGGIKYKMNVGWFEA
jgi:hypothetical protein